ncbi:hypothetical protein FDECE_14570 [Fusarium decemcellulare]|nr:hypothetical protein FDECE_14570 [Fusarium decemcellulare]
MWYQKQTWPSSGSASAAATAAGAKWVAAVPAAINVASALVDWYWSRESTASPESSRESSFKSIALLFLTPIPSAESESFDVAIQEAELLKSLNYEVMDATQASCTSQYRQFSSLQSSIDQAISDLSARNATQGRWSLLGWFTRDTAYARAKVQHNTTLTITQYIAKAGQRDIYLLGEKLDDIPAGNEPPKYGAICELRHYTRHISGHEVNETVAKGWKRNAGGKFTFCKLDALLTELEQYLQTSVVDVINDNAVRIMWTKNYRAHVARHKLHLNDCDILYIDDLIKDMDVHTYCDESAEYRDDVYKKLRRELPCLLHCLTRDDHISLRTRNPHGAV